MIDRLTIDKIYSAADIVDVVSDFVTLKKKGVNYQACCPFHNEKTPSFVVSPSKGLFKCFGCGKGGNAVSFVMEHENMTYPEALKYVARKYGIEVLEKEMTGEEKKKNDDRESMYIVNGHAAEWFCDRLHNSDDGKSIGLSYFRSRGFTDNTIIKFGLGYCPGEGNEFVKSATRDGYKEEFLLGTGLAGKRDDGTLYDRFSGRVMFPIHTVSGRIAAFGGRTMRTDKKTAKYINSPESEIYHKSNILYGLYFAKKSITQEDCCILVEGYTDVLSMHQSGIENVVASSGTALTTEQIRLIGRFTRNVTVIFDSDQAGINASLRGIDLILREGINVRVVSLPQGEDPDSFARSRSGAEVKQYIKENEKDFISYKTGILLQDAGNDPIKRAELITDIVSSIAEIPDPITRSVYIRDTATGMGMDHKVLVSEVARRRLAYDSGNEARDFIRRQQKLQAQTSVPAEKYSEYNAGSIMEDLEKEIVKYLLKYGQMNFDFKEGREIISLNVAEIIINDIESNGINFSSPVCRTIYELYSGKFSSEEVVDMHVFINHPDPDVCNAVVDILTDNENYVVSRLWEKHDIVVESEDEQLARTVPRLIMLYKSKAIERIIDGLQAELGSSSLADDRVADITFKIAVLNKERMALAKKLSRLIL